MLAARHRPAERLDLAVIARLFSGGLRRRPRSRWASWSRSSCASSRRPSRPSARSTRGSRCSTWRCGCRWCGCCSTASRRAATSADVVVARLLAAGVRRRRAAAGCAACASASCSRSRPATRSATTCASATSRAALAGVGLRAITLRGLAGVDATIPYERLLTGPSSASTSASTTPLRPHPRRPRRHRPRPRRRPRPPGRGASRKRLAARRPPEVFLPRAQAQRLDLQLRDARLPLRPRARRPLPQRPRRAPARRSSPPSSRRAVPSDSLRAHATRRARSLPSPRHRAPRPCESPRSVTLHIGARAGMDEFPPRRGRLPPTSSPASSPATIASVLVGDILADRPRPVHRPARRARVSSTARQPAAAADPRPRPPRLRPRQLLTSSPATSSALRPSCRSTPTAAASCSSTATSTTRCSPAPTRRARAATWFTGRLRRAGLGPVAHYFEKKDVAIKIPPLRPRRRPSRRRRPLPSCASADADVRSSWASTRRRLRPPTCLKGTGRHRHRHLQRPAASAVVTIDTCRPHRHHRRRPAGVTCPRGHARAAPTHRPVVASVSRAMLLLIVSTTLPARRPRRRPAGRTGCTRPLSSPYGHAPGRSRLLS